MKPKPSSDGPAARRSTKAAPRAKRGAMASSDAVQAADSTATARVQRRKGGSVGRSRPVAKEQSAAGAGRSAKLMRDSYTIPKGEYAVLEALKQRAGGLQRPAKRSELLRAGVAALNAMDDRAFLSALEGVPNLKTGRPPKAVDAGKKKARS